MDPPSATLQDLTDFLFSSSGQDEPSIALLSTLPMVTESTSPSLSPPSPPGASPSPQTSPTRSQTPPLDVSVSQQGECALCGGLLGASSEDACICRDLDGVVDVAELAERSLSYSRRTAPATSPAHTDNSRAFVHTSPPQSSFLSEADRLEFSADGFGAGVLAVSCSPIDAPHSTADNAGYEKDLIHSIEEAPVPQAYASTRKIVDVASLSPSRTDSPTSTRGDMDIPTTSEPLDTPHPPPSDTLEALTRIAEGSLLDDSVLQHNEDQRESVDPPAEQPSAQNTEALPRRRMLRVITFPSAETKQPQAAASSGTRRSRVPRPRSSKNRPQLRGEGSYSRLHESRPPQHATTSQPQPRAVATVRGKSEILAKSRYRQPRNSGKPRAHDNQENPQQRTQPRSSRRVRTVGGRSLRILSDVNTTGGRMFSVPEQSATQSNPLKKPLRINTRGRARKPRVNKKPPDTPSSRPVHGTSEQELRRIRKHKKKLNKIGYEEALRAMKRAGVSDQ